MSLSIPQAQYIGDSEDPKPIPTDAVVGTRYEELDTHIIYYWTGSKWKTWKQLYKEGEWAGTSATGGTSEAAPWVAGAAAALKSLHPSWTPAQIKSDLQTNGIAQDAPCNTSTGIGGLAFNPNSGSSEKILNLAAID